MTLGAPTYSQLILCSLTFLVLAAPAHGHAEPFGKTQSVPLDTQTDLASVPSDLFTLKLRNGLEVRLDRAPSDNESLLKFQSLSPAEQTSFLQRRKDILEVVAKAMIFPRLCGVVAFAKDTIQKFATTCQTQVSALSAFRYLPKPDRLGSQDAPAPLDADQVMGAQARVSDSLRERGLPLIHFLITNIDSQLWKASEALASADSAGYTVFISPNAGFALYRYGFLAVPGLELDFGKDFVRGTSYAEWKWSRQKLDKSLMICEANLTIGVLRHFQLRNKEPQVQGEIPGEALTSSFVLPGSAVNFRRTDDYVGAGGSFNLNGFDLLIATGIGIDPTGLVAIGGIGLKALSSFSAYFATYERKPILSDSQMHSTSQSLRQYLAEKMASGLDHLKKWAAPLEKVTPPLQCRHIFSDTQ